MSCRFTELRCKEVGCLADGMRLGFVSDVVVEVPEGCVAAIVGPGPCRFWGLFGRQDDYVIPWSCIRRGGPDIILVYICPKDCCVPRSKGFW